MGSRPSALTLTARVDYPPAPPAISTATDASSGHSSVIHRRLPKDKESQRNSRLNYKKFIVPTT